LGIKSGFPSGESGNRTAETLRCHDHQVGCGGVCASTVSLHRDYLGSLGI